MFSRYHILSSLIFLFLYPLLGWYVLVIILASILIDADHYFFFVTRKKSFNIFYMPKYFKVLIKKIRKYEGPRLYVLMVFHTIEFLILAFIFALFFEIFMLIFIGFIFHIFCDFIDGYFIHKDHVKKSFSVIGYIRTKNKFLG